MAPKAIIREIVDNNDSEAMRYYIQKRSLPVDYGYETPCWDWNGYRFRNAAKISYTGSDGKRAKLDVRTAIVTIVMQQDRLGNNISTVCGFDACVNPDHMQYKPAFGLTLLSLVEAGDCDVVLEFLKKSSEKVHSDKWEGDPCWESADAPLKDDGYIYIQKRNADVRTTVFAHRLLAELFSGQPLDGAPVHHKCANRRCLNPEHYQVTSHCQNTAEMMARKFYENRISQAESIMADLLKTLPEGPERDRVEAFLLAA